MSLFGFTFCGKHSSDFCTVYKSETRAILPAIRRSTIQIPRRSGLYDATGKVWDERAETITCFARRMPEHDSMKDQVREIACWLSGQGELAFDDEPGRYYTARVVGQTAVEAMPHYATFTVEFAINPPFAHSKEYVVCGDSIVLRNDGTVESPCVIELTAPGESVRVTAGAQSFSVSGLTAGQLVRVNSEDYTCTVNGENALHLMEGDFITIPPRADFALSADPPCALTLRYRRRWL